MAKDTCKQTVYPNERRGSFYPHSCKKPIWKDGFCKVHHPDSQEKRAEESRIRFEKKMENDPICRL